MKSFEDNTHAFVVRVWLEPREIEDAPPEWRGVIEHVPTGERRYLKNLDDIRRFIVSYLENMGVKLSQRGRIGKLLLFCKQHFLT